MTDNPKKKKEASPEKKVRPKTSLELHKIMTEHGVRACGCNIEKNPNFCPYQEFIDGFNFVPDVGNGQTRGEIFTPRFVVDYMIVENGILPKEAIYDLQYTHQVDEEGGDAIEYSEEALRKFIGGRVFEPAVGSGNYSASILWHKLEYANALALKDIEYIEEGTEAYEERIRRYEVYTLVAAASMYFNDIDAGNLQTTKWRMHRNGAIYSKANIDFWVKYYLDSMDSKVLATNKISESDIRKVVESSLLKASESWSAKDSDGGVLDALYLKHTGNSNIPEWLRASWDMILDHNGKLFNGIVEDDAADKNVENVSESFIVPGYRHVSWDFWWFDSLKTMVKVTKRQVPLYRQIKMFDIKEVQSRGVEQPTLSFGEDEGFGDYSFENKSDEKKYKTLKEELIAAELEVKSNKDYQEVTTFNIMRKEQQDSFTKLSKPSKF